MSDLRYAFRQLLKSPGFTFVTVVTLALGIGANTAIFSLIDAALLRPLRYPNPQQLVQVWSVPPNAGPFPTATGPEYKQWRDHATLLDSIAILSATNLNLTGNGPAQRIGGLATSSSFLRVLGLQPLLGRGFTPAEDRAGQGSPVVILAYEWWQSQFGGDPSLVGRTIEFNNVPYKVVGILPPRALVQDDAAFLVPLVLEGGPTGQEWRMAPDTPWATVVARLKPGATLAQAETELQSLNRDLYATLPSSAQTLGVSVRSLQSQLAAGSKPALLMLLGAVGLVLLIACANVANLLLARAATRQKEMAVRAALGAAQGRIVRQVLTESVLLSVGSGVLGVAVAALGIQALGRLLAGRLPPMMQPSLDLTVLAFSLVVACGTGLVFGIFPALRARRVDLNRDLRDAGRGSTSARRTKSQSLLVVSQVALTMTLLAGTGLLLRSFAKVLAADPGFNPHHSLAFDLSLTFDKFARPEQLLQYEREIVRQLGELPGISSVGLSTTVPLSNAAWGGHVRRTGQASPRDDVATDVDYVSGDYFRAMGIRQIRGRTFTDADEQPNAPRVAIVNERFATQLFPGRDPIGRQVHIDDLDWEIVGMVGDVRQRQLDAPPVPRIYRVHSLFLYNTCVVARTNVAPSTVMNELRRAMAKIDPDQSVANLRTLDFAVSQSLAERRLTLTLIGLFAAVALGLACLGLYGVMAYTISQRQRELCIRLALGAQRGDVIRLILADGLRLSAAGLALGLLGGLGAGQLVASRLYDVNPFDPLVFGSAVALFTAVSIASVLVPAIRAARANPLAALRAE
ncbi:MAG TPA: ABC transporter permease [Opitutus sp.]|nr:ABC transporter permease [Opitutus sp.]